MINSIIKLAIYVACVLIIGFSIMILIHWLDIKRINKMVDEAFERLKGENNAPR